MAETIHLPKGTKDVLPADVHRWQYLEQVLRGTAQDFGFAEIRFPTFEHTELFIRGVGDTTDIVQKEMYTFMDKGGRSITLRPEGTASVARSVIENSLYAGTLPLKVYYIAPNFRYERPQAGRYREHHQFGVEYFGAASPEADAEVIALADTYLHRLGIGAVSVAINSIGCPVCRPGYHAALRAYYEAHRDALCPLCLDRLARNPLRLLDCKTPSCAALADGAPRTVDSLCAECSTHFSDLQRLLALMEIPFRVDAKIVRGLDYYTKTVFEFIAAGIGAQATVCGGGRYDGLIAALGGPPLPGLGFGSGMERLLLTMEEHGAPFPDPPAPALFLASAGAEADAAVTALTCALRRRGIMAARDTTGRSLKAQMKYADKLGVRCTLIIGGDELVRGRTVLKNMRTGEATEIGMTAEEITAFLQNGLLTERG